MIGKLPVTVIVIAQNEEVNIEKCVSSVVDWAYQVFVVDAFSTDRTPEIAQNCGAKVVQHEFKDWASQRNWALENLPIETEWVFFLDADEQVTDNFKQVLKNVLLASPYDLAGIYVRFDYYFLGRCLAYAYEAPPVMRIIRRGRARWIGKGAREYCLVEGKTLEIKEPLIHRDRKGLDAWIEKQNRNATREALLILNAEKAIGGSRNKGSIERPFRTWVRNHIYPRLPKWLRPFLHFTYRYFLRGGFLDGYPGFVFCFLHAFWFPLLIDAKVYEAKQKNDRQ